MSNANIVNVRVLKLNPVLLPYSMSKQADLNYK